MSERLVNVDRETSMLLPVDMRQWVSADERVQFVIQAVETMKLPALTVNQRGSGSRQYPPRMILALVIHCYANGVMSSRRIEQAPCRDLIARYRTGDTHPDHDTISAFRREDAEAVKQAFLELLHLARLMGLLKVGIVSVDGTHIKADASNSEGAAGEQKLPREIARREALLEKMRWAGRNHPRMGRDRRPGHQTRRRRRTPSRSISRIPIVR